ncbi:hypothetical protein F0237_17705 [Vibrio tubiashii]|uniref:Uncharacterized protein n=1 Tax=Vibrio tubiashii TaxID=29498 RepID=A0AAE5GSP0_9VIBR|nr:hypothetical protein [Vibrio tubiashii]NOI82507.1 hypothetical protein [Vibrio tubiashii]
MSEKKPKKHLVTQGIAWLAINLIYAYLRISGKITGAVRMRTTQGAFLKETIGRQNQHLVFTETPMAIEALDFSNVSPSPALEHIIYEGALLREVDLGSPRLFPNLATITLRLDAECNLTFLRPWSESGVEVHIKTNGALDLSTLKGVKIVLFVELDEVAAQQLVPNVVQVIEENPLDLGLPFPFGARDSLVIYAHDESRNERLQNNDIHAYQDCPRIVIHGIQHISQGLDCSLFPFPDGTQEDRYSMLQLLEQWRDTQAKVSPLGYQIANTVLEWATFESELGWPLFYYQTEPQQYAGHCLPWIWHCHNELRALSTL